MGADRTHSCDAACSPPWLDTNKSAVQLCVCILSYRPGSVWTFGMLRTPKHSEPK